MSADLRSLAALLAALVATVIGADVLLQRVYPVPPPLVEARDALAELKVSDPATLLLGSSHARAFSGVRGEILRRSQDQNSLLCVPLEYGKLSSYAWLLENRIAPMVDERDASGQLVRPSLSRLVLVTSWWDACGPEDDLAPNVPARAWSFEHYVRDVAENGLTPYNRNYTAALWTQLWPASLLVQDRGKGLLRDALIQRMRPDDRGDTAGLRRRVEYFQNMVEGGASDPGCDSTQERQGLDAMLRFAEERGLDVTIILFPLMPASITEQARRTTLAQFSRRMQVLADERGFRLLDYTTGSPIGDGDFARDLDHPNASGVAKLVDWGLDHGLGFLLEPGPRRRDR